jgi:hypothetical protein
LTGRTIFLGNTHTNGTSKRSNRLGKTRPSMLDQEGNGATVRTTSKAMIELLCGANGK